MQFQLQSKVSLHERPKNVISNCNFRKMQFPITILGQFTGATKKCDIELQFQFSLHEQPKNVISNWDLRSVNMSDQKCDFQLRFKVSLHEQPKMHFPTAI